MLASLTHLFKFDFFLNCSVANITFHSQKAICNRADLISYERFIKKKKKHCSLIIKKNLIITPVNYYFTLYQ